MVKARQEYLEIPRNPSPPRDYWLSKGDQDLNRKRYIGAIRGFNRKIKVVAGEANSKLFNSVEFAVAVKEGLEANPTSSFTMSFHKYDDKEKAWSAFLNENKHIVELKRKFPDRVHIHWAPKRPRQHYLIVDEETCIFEQPDHPIRKGWWGNLVHNPSIASYWERRFDEYIELCPEIELSDS